MATLEIADDILTSYTNGNVHVTILKDGTKIRRYEGKPKPIYPESMDVKITSFCDLGCPYCYESSCEVGNHCNIYTTLSLADIPHPCELAIGGGNPLAHPRLLQILTIVGQQGHIANLTVNQAHVQKYMNTIKLIVSKKMIHGLGISVKECNNHLVSIAQISPHVVFHFISGIHSFEYIYNTIARVSEATGMCRCLILGYKGTGRGRMFDNRNHKIIREKQLSIYNNMEKLLNLNDAIISFDNLALEQLDVKSSLSQEFWDKFYMGDDGDFTMYYDAVSETYYRDSYHKTFAKSAGDISIRNYFRELRKYNERP